MLQKSNAFRFSWASTLCKMREKTWKTVEVVGKQLEGKPWVLMDFCKMIYRLTVIRRGQFFFHEKKWERHYQAAGDENQLSDLETLDLRYQRLLLDGALQRGALWVFHFRRAKLFFFFAFFSGWTGYSGTKNPTNYVASHRPCFSEKKTFDRMHLVAARNVASCGISLAGRCLFKSNFAILIYFGSSGQTLYNTAVDETHNLLYVATSGGNSAGRSIIELPLSISGATMPYKAGDFGRDSHISRTHQSCESKTCRLFKSFVVRSVYGKRKKPLVFRAPRDAWLAASRFIVHCTAMENAWWWDTSDFAEL